MIPKDEPIVSRPFTAFDYAGGIVVFFICWAVYLHTLTPTIGFHDSGDMITAAYVLGIPHPTGYPLYCLLSKLWMTILPIGNIAYRMNLASALCASLACMMVYFIILKLTVDSFQFTVKKDFSVSPILHFFVSISKIIPAIVGALMLAFATTFWEQAVIAEKYILNGLFTTLIIFILIKWQEMMNLEQRARCTELNAQRSTLNAQRLLSLFAFTLGLSFTHHMQTIYLVPASLFFIVAVWWKKLSQEKQPIHSLLTISYLLLLKMLCLFILPLFLYLYLPIRVNVNPPYCYGDPETLERCIAHITGGEYKDRYISTVSGHDFLKRMQEHIDFFPYQFTPYLVWIGIIGIFTFFKRKLFLVFFCVIVITNIFFAIQYNIPNIKDYYIISYLIFSILIGLGAREVVVRGVYPIYRNKIKLHIHILYIFILFLPILSFSIHYQSNNYNNYYLAYDYNRNILKPLKEKSLVILTLGYDEVVFPSAYIQWVENYRSDVAIVIYVGLVEEWYIDLLKKNYPYLVINFPSQQRDREMKLEKIKRERLNNLIVHNIDKYPIYTWNQELFSNYQLIPGENIMLRILKREVTLDKMCEEFKEVDLNLRGIHKGKINRKYPSTPIEKKIIENYAFAYMAKGEFYYYIKEYNKAIVSVRKAIEINPNFQEAHYFRNTILKECTHKGKIQKGYDKK
ncbi:MAG: DUF2723 domain-containing protein [bacterium]